LNTKKFLRLGLLVFAVAAPLAGCATGLTEFKIIKATPTPPITPTVAATPVPEARVATETAAPDTTKSGQPCTYVVQPGESLWRISRRLLGDPLAYHRVAKANGIQNPDLIQPGRALTLDPAWIRPEQALAPKVVPSASTPCPSAETPGVPQAKPAAPAACQPEERAYPCRPNPAFGPGERLTFSVEYFGVSAGFATLAVEDGPSMNDRPTLHLIASARTHPAFEWVFKVRDRIESFLDAQGLFSWRYEKHLREGSYSNDSVIIYDQPNRRVIKDQGRTVVPAPAWTQDVLSEFYFFRAMSFNVGDTLTIPVVADDGKSYELLVKVLRKERVAVPAGTFNCLVVQPTLKFEGLFQQKGTINIWVTDDPRHVPVLIKTKIAIGTIDIVLRNATVVEQ